MAASMKAMIFAAGLGTRLRPLTDTMPKALVKVCGKTLLEYSIEKLKAAGFTQIVINVHHFADMIREYVREKGSFGIEISFSDESDLLRETGGGIRHAAALLNDGEPFLVHNVDILSNLDIPAMVGGYNAASASSAENGESHLATLLVSERVTERYLLFDNEARLVAWMNVRTGEVRSPFEELKRNPVADGETFDCEVYTGEYGLKKYAFDGVHIISPEIFKLMVDKPEKFSIIGFYLSYCDKWPITAHIQPGLRVVDVGKVNSIQKAEELVADVHL